jgi:SAM-dependent methyltransferase
MSILRTATDVHQTGSFATRLRRKRFALFQTLLAGLPRPLRILDVGGTQGFWETMGMADAPGLEFWVINLSDYEFQSARPQFHQAVGDARHMPQFADQEFDVVFSNSVIEHVGGYADQRRMAREIRRVGRRYFVQTPNRYFPIEPHYLYPFFQFYPPALKRGLVRHLRLGWGNLAEATTIRLLSKRELLALFPGSRLYAERLFGLNKSFVVYGGWDE